MNYSKHLIRIFCSGARFGNGTKVRIPSEIKPPLVKKFYNGSTEIKSRIFIHLNTCSWNIYRFKKKCATLYFVRSELIFKVALNAICWKLWFHCAYMYKLWNVIRICGKDVACSTCKLLMYKSRGEHPKMYRNFIFFVPMKTWKKTFKSRIPYRNFRNFQYCRPAQNQTKFQILFHKNSSPHDLYTMNLIACMQTFVRNCWIEFRFVCNEVLNGTTSIALSRIRVNISWSNFENIVSKYCKLLWICRSSQSSE